MPSDEWVVSPPLHENWATPVLPEVTAGSVALAVAVVLEGVVEVVVEYELDEDLLMQISVHHIGCITTTYEPATAVSLFGTVSFLLSVPRPIPSPAPSPTADATTTATRIQTRRFRRHELVALPNEASPAGRVLCSGDDSFSGKNPLLSELVALWCCGESKYVCRRTSGDSISFGTWIRSLGWRTTSGAL